MEAYLHKRQFTPYEQHKRSRDVLAIDEDSNLAVLRSPLLDEEEYEFGYFDKGGVSTNYDELRSNCVEIGSRFASELIVGNVRCSFVQYGLGEAMDDRQLDDDDDDDNEVDDGVTDNNKFADDSVSLVLEPMIRELWQYIHESSKFIEFDVRCSFVCVDYGAHTAASSSTIVTDLLTAQHCGLSCNEAVQAHVFSPRHIAAAYRKGACVFRERSSGAGSSSSISGSNLLFTLYVTQRNRNTNHSRHSRYDHMILVAKSANESIPSPGVAGEQEVEFINAMNMYVKRALNKPCPCPCLNAKRCAERNDSDMLFVKSCRDCFLTSILEHSDHARILISVSPSSLAASTTFRVIEFGKLLTSICGRPASSSEEINLIDNIKILEQVLFDDRKVSKEIKLNEKLKLRTVIGNSKALIESNENKVADLEQKVAFLEHALNEKDEQIRDLTNKPKNEQPVEDSSEHVNNLKDAVEFALKISIFRERQAVYFLRQFRRFYRRVLKHKAIQGDTNIHTLDSMHGIDETLLKLGIISEYDIKFDDAPIVLNSSDEHDLSEMAAKEAFDLFQIVLESGKYAILERDMSTSTDLKLMNELSAVNEKCAKLQLEIEKLKNSNLVEQAEPTLVKKECVALKSQLDQSKEELNAVIWKLNELNTNNLLLSQQADFAGEMETLVKELQEKVRLLSIEKDTMHKKFMEENASLQKKVNDLSFPKFYPYQPNIDPIDFEYKLDLPMFGAEVSALSHDFASHYDHFNIKHSASLDKRNDVYVDAESSLDSDGRAYIFTENVNYERVDNGIEQIGSHHWNEETSHNHFENEEKEDRTLTSDSDGSDNDCVSSSRNELDKIDFLREEIPQEDNLSHTKSRGFRAHDDERMPSKNERCKISNIENISSKNFQDSEKTNLKQAHDSEKVEGKEQLSLNANGCTNILPNQLNVGKSLCRSTSQQNCASSSQDIPSFEFVTNDTVQLEDTRTEKKESSSTSSSSQLGGETKSITGDPSIPANSNNVETSNEVIFNKNQQDQGAESITEISRSTGITSLGNNMLLNDNESDSKPITGKDFNLTHSSDNPRSTGLSNNIRSSSSPSQLGRETKSIAEDLSIPVNLNDNVETSNEVILDKNQQDQDAESITEISRSTGITSQGNNMLLNDTESASNASKDLNLTNSSDNPRSTGLSNNIRSSSLSSQPGVKSKSIAGDPSIPANSNDNVETLIEVVLDKNQQDQDAESITELSRSTDKTSQDKDRLLNDTESTSKRITGKDFNLTNSNDNPPSTGLSNNIQSDLKPITGKGFNLTTPNDKILSNSNEGVSTLVNIQSNASLEASEFNTKIKDPSSIIVDKDRGVQNVERRRLFFERGHMSEKKTESNDRKKSNSLLNESQNKNDVSYRNLNKAKQVISINKTTMRQCTEDYLRSNAANTKGEFIQNKLSSSRHSCEPIGHKSIEEVSQTTSIQNTKSLHFVENDVLHNSERKRVDNTSFLNGGKSASDEPRRFAQKIGKQIRSGVVKKTRKSRTIRSSRNN